MTKDFEHIVITGASSGIGEALAHAYAQQGVTLSLTGRDEQRLDAVSQKCREKGADVVAKRIDVTDKAAMKDWLLLRNADRAVDLIVANAGISGGPGSSHIEDPDQLNRLMDVNVRGVFNTITPLLPNMVERKKGQIAIMSSLAAFRGMPGAAAYCASKAAVKIYGEGLRGQLDGTGVGVSVICPGYVRSRMTDKNDFPMPFFMESSKAAGIIINGLSKNKGRIAFPVPTAVVAWLFSVMPNGFVHLLLKGAPTKKPLN